VVVAAEHELLPEPFYRAALEVRLTFQQAIRMKILPFLQIPTTGGTMRTREAAAQVRPVFLVYLPAETVLVPGEELGGLPIVR